MNLKGKNLFVGDFLRQEGIKDRPDLEVVGFLNNNVVCVRKKTTERIAEPLIFYYLPDLERFLVKKEKKV